MAMNVEARPWNPRCSYDEAADVLYLTITGDSDGKTRAEDDGLIWRYDRKHGWPIGVTVLDLRHYWGDKLPQLLARLKQELQVEERQARLLLERFPSGLKH